MALNLGGGGSSEPEVIVDLITAPLRSAPWISAINSFDAPAKSPDRYCV